MYLRGLLCLPSQPVVIGLSIQSNYFLLKFHVFRQMKASDRGTTEVTSYSEIIA